MVALARDVSGLIYQSDGSFTGWTSGGSWSSMSAPGYTCFGALPIALLGPSGTGSDSVGVREAQLYIESGVWYLKYDAGNAARDPWRVYMATSHDRGVTWERHGPTNDSIGSYTSLFDGWLEKRGSTYIRHRMPASGSVVGFGNKYRGLATGPYLWDIWTATDPLGPWSYFANQPPVGGTWATPGYAMSCVVKVGSTYYAFTSGDNDAAESYTTSSSPTGPFPVRGTATDIYGGSDSRMGGWDQEGGAVFIDPNFGGYTLLANAYPPPGGWNDRATCWHSSSITNWSGASVDHVLKVCPADGENAIGEMRHVTGPDGTLIYDRTTGFIPITYDTDATAYGPSSHGWHFGRKIKGAVLEPSAACLHYTGSADTTARSITRPISCTSVVIECSVRIDSGGVNVGGGSFSIDLINGSSNGYRFKIIVGGVGSIFKIMAGSPSRLQAGSGACKFDADPIIHRVKIAIQSGTLNIWLDGELHATATDSTTMTFTTLALTGSGLNCNVRSLSARTGDIVTVQGLTPGTSCHVRGYGAFLAGSVLSDDSGVATFTIPHYPLWSLDIGGTDYTPTGGIWGGDTLTFTGLSSVSRQSLLSF